MKSMQTNIIIFFVLSALLAMSLTLLYVSYNYKQQLEADVRGSLYLILSDIKHEHLANDGHHAKLDFFHDELKETAFSKLLMDLNTQIVEKLPDNGETDLIVYSKLEDGSYLYISCSKEPLNDEVINFILKTLAVFIVIFILMLTMFTLFVNRQFRSLHCLVDFCSSYQEDKERVPVCDGTYEVKNLRNAILTLIDTNDYLCDQKQELFKEAAHELKSPIAVLKARLSLFGSDATMDKNIFIQESQEDISNITSKLKELIFLKSIEWDMQLPREDVNMEDNCKLMQDAFEPILRKKSVQVESNWEESFIIHTYKDAMQKVLQAVFENIFIHTKQNSVIVVQAKPNEIFIKNEIGGGDDIPLFSSYIGIKMIERLSSKLGYEYKSSSDERYFYTRLIFHSMQGDRCNI